jgi:tRNA-dihydrouridine synthase A
MRTAVAVPVTVKTRIGIDRDESLDQLNTFVDTVADAGCKSFIVHARRAWLSGISPKQNREVPPLNYERVYELKRSRPNLTIVINGGIKTLDAAGRHLDKVDGVMMGREAYATPYLLAQVDNRFYGSRCEPLSREAVLEHYLEYCEREMENGYALNHMSRHLTGLFHGQAGARRWRQCVNEYARRTEAGVELIRRAAPQRVSAAGADNHH